MVDVLHSAAALYEFFDVILRRAVIDCSRQLDDLARDFDIDLACVDHWIVRQFLADDFLQAVVRPSVALGALAAMCAVLGVTLATGAVSRALGWAERARE